MQSVDLHSLYLQWAKGSWNGSVPSSTYVNMMMQLGSEEIARPHKQHIFAADVTRTVCFEIKNNINIPVTVLQYGPQIPKYVV